MTRTPGMVLASGSIGRACREGGSCAMARSVVAGVALLAGASAQAGGSIHVSEVTGASPGSAVGPIPVRFVRLAAQPTAAFRVVVAFDPALFTEVVATPVDGASCEVDQPAGQVTLAVTGTTGDLPTAIHCQILVTRIAAGIPANTRVLLTPLFVAPGFDDGGCFDASAQTIPCGLFGGDVTISISDTLFKSGFDH